VYIGTLEHKNYIPEYELGIYFADPELTIPILEIEWKKDLVVYKRIERTN
jgi:hypothetical protein